MNYSPNIDITEIAKFNAMAGQWWEPNGPCAPLHVLNPTRLQFIQKFTELDNKDVLDVGCGAGILAESLAKCGAKVTGIDAGADVIAAAIAHAKIKDMPVTYLNKTIEEYLSTHSDRFDIITCMELIEHVPNPSKLIADCTKLLRPGGQIFLSTINRTPKAYALAIIGAEYVLNMLPKHTHDYKKFIRPAELAVMLKQANMQLMDLQGLNFKPFTKTAHLQDDLSVNYLAYAKREDHDNII